MIDILRLVTSRRARNAYRAQRINASKPTHAELRNGKFDRAIVATVAFNRPDVVEWQIHLVRKFLAEHEGYIVFDNSSKPEQRQAVQALCKRENVPYVGLPRISFEQSHSHGAALNWITQNFIVKHRPPLFGFVDHDIFPLEPLSIAEKIAGAQVYGWEMSRGDARYLWAGFCFFSGVDPRPLDFFPFKPPHVEASDWPNWLDTGGSNWNILYRHLREDEFRAAQVQSIPTTPRGIPFDEIDGWLHAGQAAWQWDDHPKDRLRLLEERLFSAYGSDHPQIAMRPI